MTLPTPTGDGAWEVDGEATLFGFEATPLQATIQPRSRGWRMGGALRTMAVFVVVAPFAALFPPHAVWPIGVLLTGGFLARRRYVERFTLRTLDATCPRCGTPFRVRPGRLLIPHPLPCEGCHHESAARIPGRVLEEIAVD